MWGIKGLVQIICLIHLCQYILTYNSKLAPSGSTDTISKWLAEQASAPVEFPRGMVRTVFDNEQVIGKTHKVKANNKVPSSIVTSHMYISMDPDSTMQKDASFSPQKWLFADPNEIQKTYFLEDKAINMDNFRITRDEFIKRRLVSVVEEHDLEGRDIIDEIMAKKCESCKEKVCFDCGAQNEYSCRKCTNCGGQLTYEKPDLSQLMDRKSEMKPYGSFITVLTEENKFTVKTGEPDLCNPGSFENVAQILSNISVRANVGEEVTNDRKWLFLECDGGIYSLVEKLIFNVYFCKRCSESFYGLESFTDHRCQILHDIEPEHRFGWILPLPGLLHLEMNACKVFFELTWDVILKDICSKLGYSSPKALEFAKKCGDHHKSWKVLEIVYLAIADELLVPYVRKCLSDKSEPSVDGYWIWAAEIADPNYMFLQQMVFTFLHSLMLFRIGCRRGNADAIYAGRDKMSLMFFARHHPSYQRIVTLNRYIEAMMPEDLRKIVASSLTLSRTGNHGHYQGGDACLEEINKEAKRWIGPKGIPTEDEWKRVFRNLDGLMQLQKKTVQMASKNLKVSTTYDEEQKVAFDEIMPVRELLRTNGYLLHPMDKKDHKSVDGMITLTEELAYITDGCRVLREQYQRSFLSSDEKKLNIIFITEEEKNEKLSIENQTKAEILKQIFQNLDLKEQNEAKILEELFTKTVKGKSKEKYLQFYYMIIDNVQ